MYPMSPTMTEELIKLIEDSKRNTEPTDGEILRQMIDEHDTSGMREGVAYYLNENDILQKKQYYYTNGQKIEDTEGLKPNNKIPHNWHRILVDQKSSYIVGKPITFSADDDGFLELINEMANEEFDDMMNELVKNASNKGVEWLHPFIDEAGQFDYMIIPAEQVIPIYKDEKKKELAYAIRYYDYWINGKQRMKAELYTPSEVWYYIQPEDRDDFVLDVEEPENPASHFYIVNKNTPEGEQEQGYPWQKVPLIPFRNNEEEKNDLTFYKELIDEYDQMVSDNANAFESLQRLVYVLKGYEGQDLSEFVSNLLYYGAINVDGEGGVDTLEPNLDMTASDLHLDRLNESIFLFGQGVNPSTDKFAAAPSGVALKFLYSLLDLKANHVERKFRAALQQFMWFFTEYLSITGQGDYDPDSVKFTFNRTMITNEKEKVDMANTSKGVVSDLTLLENHPFVTDPQEELQRLEDQRQAYQTNLPPIGGDPGAQSS